MNSKIGQKNPPSGGGRATAAGIEYQSRVGAYFCVQILAEKDIVPAAWDFETNETLEAIEGETNYQVDDLLLHTSVGRRVFINVKRRLTNSTSETSDFAKAINQLVRQFLQDTDSGSRNDKLILVTSPSSSETIKTHFYSLLVRIRNSRSGQPSANLVRNNDERKVLETVKKHIITFWTQKTNAVPSDDQIIELLKSIRLEVLDVDAGGKDEQIAQTWLNSLILDDYQAAAAWNHLVGFCLTLYSQSGGADRNKLQAEMLRSGRHLKNTRSYQEDIKKLKELTRKTFLSLQNLSVIKCGQKSIKIKRPVKDILISAADTGSVVVIGEPGSGKSGVLYDFVEDRINQKRDVFFLAVDKIEAGSKTEFHQEFRLEHDFNEVLSNWVGNEPGYLVIDALDASRDAGKARFINNLLEDVLQNNKRWKVIVSIRKFDLRYNAQLQNLFAGRLESEYISPEFTNLRHINIPKLETNEWLQIPQQYPDFGTLFLQADDNLRELLFVPFNLRLLGELFGEGVSIGELSPIRTQIELLERYWQERVIGSDFRGDTREAVLAKVVGLMVEKRRMQINRQEIIDAATGNTLGEILSQNVLAEWQASEVKTERSILTFSHHVVFDYAVARLFLRGTNEIFIGKLESDNDLVLAIRPSILLHFQYELLKGNLNFWKLVFSVIRSEKIPAIGKLIGTSAAVGSAEEVEFFKPFFDLLTSIDTNSQQIGVETLTHLARELRVKASESLAFLFSGEKLLWTNFLKELSKILTPSIAHNIRYIMWSFINQADDFANEQLLAFGIVSRRLLNFAFDSPQYDSLLANSSISFVCLTFTSNIEESTKVLRRVLEPSHVKEYGHDELRLFANYIENLSVLDPILVEEIYRVAFTNFDYSEEKTSMSHSRILNMTSTRRQDFKMMRYALKNKYAKFLKQSPRNAVLALIDAVNAFVEEEYASRLDGRRKWTVLGDFDETDNRVSETFFFNNKEVHLKSDYSEMWETNSGYRDSETLEMLKIFSNYFEDLCANERGKQLWEEIFALIIEENQNAVFWRKIIACGTKFPDTIGRELHSLAWTAPILLNQDTSRVIGNYIQNNFSNFTKDDRELTEKAILSLTDLGTNEDERRYILYDRNRLLGCLNEDYIITDETRGILDNLKREKQIPSNEPLFGQHEFSSTAYTEAMELRDGGVPLEEKSNQTIRNLYKPAENFAGKFKNNSPDSDDVINILPELQKLYETLNEPQNGDVHQLILDYAWGHLASACAAAVEAENIENDAEVVRFLKNVLLAASNHPIPEANENIEKNFDDFSSRGFPFVRGEAGSGLVRLARFKSAASDEVLSRIEELALNDSIPSVRYQIAIRINSLYETSPELMWKILDKICAEEKSSGIIIWVTQTCLRTLTPFYPDKIFELTEKVYERFRRNPKASKIKQNCTFIFGQLAFQSKHTKSREILEQFINRPENFIDEVLQIVMNAGETLNLGIGMSFDQQKDYIRLECYRLLEQICRNGYTAFQSLKSRLDEKNYSEWTEEETDKYKQLHHIIDFIITKVYFASGGAEHIITDVQDKNKILMGANERLQFWQESQGVLIAVAGTSFADVTHRLVETLEFLFPYDPKGVFLLLGKAVKNGKADNYQYESMAVGNIIKIVETVLGRYAYLLTENEECRRTMIEILDIFVEAGWDAAHKLTYRLEQIYR